MKKIFVSPQSLQCSSSILSFSITYIKKHDSRSKHNQRKSESCERQQDQFLGRKGHLNWHKVDLNAAKIITVRKVQNYEHAKKIM